MFCRIVGQGTCGKQKAGVWFRPSATCRGCCLCGSDVPYRPILRTDSRTGTWACRQADRGRSVSTHSIRRLRMVAICRPDEHRAPLPRNKLTEGAFLTEGLEGWMTGGGWLGQQDQTMQRCVSAGVGLGVGYFPLKSLGYYTPPLEQSASLRESGSRAARRRG